MTAEERDPDGARSSPPPWENEAVLKVAGRTLRPGGVELTSRALDAAGLEPGARVADVGCGLGASLELMRSRGLRCLGLDASKRLLAACHELLPDLPLLRGDFMHLPLQSSSLDGVLCECALSLSPDPGGLLLEFSRALKPGGRLMISDLHLLGHGGSSEKSRREPGRAPRSCLEGAIDLDRLTVLVARAGFRPELLEDHTPLLKRFAADLVFAGVSLGELFGGGQEVNKACEPGPGPRLGYYLMVVRRQGVSDACGVDHG